MVIPISYWYVLIAILLVFSFFFAAAETAFSFFNRIRFKAMADDGNLRAKKVLKVVENYDKFLSTILIGNNVVNIGAASVATIIFSNHFPAETAAAVSTFVMTLIILVACETLPKSIGKARADKLSMAFVDIIRFLMILLSPAIFLLVKFISLFHKKDAEERPTMTEDELKYVIESIEEEGVLEEHESELVQSALDFGDTTVQEIMTPRVNVVGLNIDDGIDVLLKKIIDEGFTRMPVYKHSVDNILGIVNVKDVLTRVAMGKEIVLKDLMKPCKFVYVTRPISQILADFRSSKNHFAVVVDDYGSTKGIVTMEDILEELVGEIWDEYDEVVKEITPLGDDVYEVSGNCNVFRLFEHLDIDHKDFECDYSTVGGWALDIFERIPKVDEFFTYKNLTVTVLEADDQRVIKLKVEKAEDLAASSDEE
jgi:CBS domain containing-hemolysin-like protein